MFEHCLVTVEFDVQQVVCTTCSDDTGLKNMYLLVYRLFSIATTLPLSTAEVERVFSQVKLIKTSHRSSIKTKTLNN
jgi:hypothetical protein